MRIHRKNAAAVLLVFFVTLFTSTILRADVTGSITGVVRDRSQAVVSGARVQVTNVQTNFTQQATTATDGSFRILALPVGTYKLTATASGFGVFNATDIDLKVNDQLHYDITLQVGTLQQQVSVEANAIQVESDNTQLGDVIESKKMLSLPLNGRSYLDLLGLQAGVVPVTSGSMQQDRPVSGYIDSPGNLSVNGQRETSNAFLVNGGDVSEGRNLGAGLVPNLDSVEEFRLITNSFDAEYGKFSGSVMNAITKSGTNSIHGDVFEFIRNDKFDAANYLDQSKAELRRNQFGYAIGGPLWKNRIFWFTDYQGTRQVVGASTGQIQLPSVDQRNGIFSASDFLDSDGNPITSGVKGDYWAQVLSQRLGYTVTNNEPYYVQGCTSSSQCVFPNAVIPSPFVAPANGILPFIPVPNVPGTVDQFSDNRQKNRVRDDKAGQRIDFISQKTGNWSFYYHYDDSTVVNAFGHNATVPGFETVTPSRAQQFVISNTKNFGPTAVNQLRASFFRTATVTDKPQSSFANLADLGFVTGVGTLGINPSGPPGYPQFVPPLFFNNFTIGVNTLTTFQPNNTYHVSDGFSKVVGPHTLKFGGEFRYLQVNERNTCAANGDFTFDGSETGSDFADFLIGAPQNYNQCSQQFLDSRTRYGGAYVQDTYKMKSNFTLNLGLRWEVSMPWYDTQGKIETIVPGLQSTQFPTAPKSWVVPGDPGIPSTLSPTRYNNFAPRVGLAYSPGFSDGLAGKIFGGPGKSSIRAAYGIFSDAFGATAQDEESNHGNWPFSFSQTLGSLNLGLPTAFIDNPFSGPPVPTSVASGLAQGMNFFTASSRTGYVHEWNFSLQRQLTPSLMLEASYVGSHGLKLPSQIIDNTASTPGTDPYQNRQRWNFPPYVENNYHENSSRYNGLSLRLDKRASKNLTFLVAFTWQKALDTMDAIGSGVNAARPHDNVNPTRFNLGEFWGPAGFDRRHNLQMGFVYQLPWQSNNGYQRSRRARRRLAD